MAQPYQDLQGNWFSAGRQMTPQEAMAMGVGQPQAGQMAAPLQAAPVVAPGVVPGAVPQPGAGMTAEQFLAASMADTQRRQQVGLNPIGAIADFFRGN